MACFIPKQLGVDAETLRNCYILQIAIIDPTEEGRLVIFSRVFPPEGEKCDSRLTVKAYQLGWRQFIIFGQKGQRFTGCRFGTETDDVRIDV